MDWLLEWNLPGSFSVWCVMKRIQRILFWCIMGSNSRIGDACMLYGAKPSLTCRCQMGDNYFGCGSILFHEASNCHIATATLRVG
jgi:hypothetical protein